MASHNFDIGLLRAFLTVYDEGSFTRASEKLHLSQSAVSLQIKRLEEMIGKQLLERDARGLRLTAHGHTLRRYARRLTQINDRAIRRMTATAADKVVTVGIPDNYVPTIMPALLTSIEQRVPGWGVEIVCNVTRVLRRMLDNGEIDIAILSENANGDETRSVLTDELCWAKAPETRVDTSRPLRLALFPDGCWFRRQALAALSAHQIRHRIIRSSLNSLVLKEAVLNDGAIAPFARHTISDDMVIAGDGQLPPLPAFRIGLYSQHRKFANFHLELARAMRVHMSSPMPSERPPSRQDASFGRSGIPVS